jgi:hypothetical protein
MLRDKDLSNQPIVTTAGTDIEGLVVTFTDRTATLTGSVAGVAKYENGAAVIAFPAERERWVDWGLDAETIRAVAVGTDGSYRLSLPGGNYLVVAVDGALIEKWQEPAFLESASRLARSLTLDWGQTQALNITVSEVR